MCVWRGGGFFRSAASNESLCLHQDSRIHVSESDFMALTLDGALLNAQGEMGPAEFQAIMRREMHTYVQTRLADFSDCRTAADLELTSIGALKTLLSEVLVMARGQHDIRRELCEVRESLLRDSQPGAGSDARRADLNSVPQALCSSNAPDLALVERPKDPALPFLFVPLNSLGEANRSIPSCLGGNGAEHVSPASAAVPDSRTVPSRPPAAPATGAVMLSARRPPVPLDSGALGAFGLGSSWAAAAGVQDRVAQEAGTVLSAIDTLTVEVAGLVSNVYGRAAAIGSDVAASLPVICRPALPLC